MDQRGSDLTLASSDFTTCTISSRMRLDGHVACMEEIRNVYNILVGKLEADKALRDTRVDGKIT
jgi:hypothetical protein